MEWNAPNILLWLEKETKTVDKCSSKVVYIILNWDTTQPMK